MGWGVYALETIIVPVEDGCQAARALRQMQSPATAVARRYASFRTAGSKTSNINLQAILASPGGAAESLAAALIERRNDAIRALEALNAEYLNSCRDLVFGMTGEPTTAAELATFDDGSALATISDAMAGLCLQYGEHTAFLLSRFDGSSALLRLIEAVRVMKGSWKDTAVITTALRQFYLLHRQHGPGDPVSLNLHDRGRLMAEFITDLAMFFVFAHETAHHVLGHGKYQTIRHDQAELEEAADRLGMRMTVQHGIQRFGTADLAVIGALAAIWATTDLERAIYLRQNATHPAAGIRTETVLAVVPEHLRKRFPIMLRQLQTAGLAASTFAAPVEDRWWNHAHRRLKRPDQAEHLRQLDQIHSDPAAAREIIARLPLPPVMNALFAAVRRTPTAQTRRDALAALDIRPQTVSEILDPALPLPFSKLRVALEEGLAGHRLDDRERMLLATALTVELGPAFA